jgi:hypothetical protein
VLWTNYDPADSGDVITERVSTQLNMELQEEKRADMR